MDRLYLFLVLLVAIFASTAHAQTMPTGCTYTDGLFECTYGTLTSNSLIPLTAASFNPIPQRLRLVEMTGTLTTALFDTDFANISTASYDTNYPATLELECINSGSITVAAGFLANMGHIEDFKIINCGLGAIPAGAFSDLGELDRFTIENGTIDSIDDNMFSGVTIRRNTTVSPSYPRKFGELRFWYTKFNGTFAPAIITGQSSMYSLTLRGMGLSSVDATLLAGVPNIRYLDLSENDLTTLPSDLYSGLVNLGVVSVYGMTITCSCSELWFLEKAATDYLTLNGDVICASDGSSYSNKLGWKYYHDTCVSEPKECSTGILLLEACMSPIEIAGFSVGFVAFVLGWVTLGITINTKKNMGGGAGTKRPGAGAKGGARKKPPAKKGVGPAKGGWP